MTSITFFFFLIPVLSIVLLAVNFLFATHTPYEEKNSAFECGFHSFLGQNRMQFNISFYIFGLLFLLFDLEILLIYPYPVSSYFNSIYGLCIMLIFFLVLTLGFAFELGKNALKIDSRQYDNLNINYKSKYIESNLFFITNLEYFFRFTLPLFILKYMPYISLSLFLISFILKCTTSLTIMCSTDPVDSDPANTNTGNVNTSENSESYAARAAVRKEAAEQEAAHATEMGRASTYLRSQGLLERYSNAVSAILAGSSDHESIKTLENEFKRIEMDKYMEFKAKMVARSIADKSDEDLARQETIEQRLKDPNHHTVTAEEVKNTRDHAINSMAEVYSRLIMDLAKQRKMDYNTTVESPEFNQELYRRGVTYNDVTGQYTRDFVTGQSNNNTVENPNNTNN